MIKRWLENLLILAMILVFMAATAVSIYMLNSPQAEHCLK